MDTSVSPSTSSLTTTGRAWWHCYPSYCTDVRPYLLRCWNMTVVFNHDETRAKIPFITARKLSLRMLCFYRCLSVQGDLCQGEPPPPGQRLPRTVKSGRYVSYWNAFFLCLTLYRTQTHISVCTSPWKPLLPNIFDKRTNTLLCRTSKLLLPGCEWNVMIKSLFGKGNRLVFL